MDLSLALLIETPLTLEFDRDLCLVLVREWSCESPTFIKKFGYELFMGENMKSKEVRNKELRADMKLYQYYANWEKNCKFWYIFY